MVPLYFYLYLPVLYEILCVFLVVIRPHHRGETVEIAKVLRNSSPATPSLSITNREYFILSVAFITSATGSLSAA